MPFQVPQANSLRGGGKACPPFLVLPERPLLGRAAGPPCSALLSSFHWPELPVRGLAPLCSHPSKSGQCPPSSLLLRVLSPLHQAVSLSCTLEGSSSSGFDYCSLFLNLSQLQAGGCCLLKPSRTLPSRLQQICLPISHNPLPQHPVLG